eukprot:scaffold1376_cov257-Pinguiococcus_pyrenoidosus.AAC.26
MRFLRERMRSSPPSHAVVLVPEADDADPHEPGVQWPSHLVDEGKRPVLLLRSGGRQRVVLRQEGASDAARLQVVSIGPKVIANVLPPQHVHGSLSTSTTSGRTTKGSVLRITSMGPQATGVAGAPLSGHIGVAENVEARPVDHHAVL